MNNERRKLKSFTVITIFIIAFSVFVGVIVWGTTSYLNQQYADTHQGCMPGQTNHTVTIQNNVVTPRNTVGSRCETLTITNLDDMQRLIAFGPHEDHVAYDGIKEQDVTKGESLRVTLVQTGTFRFHDHDNDEVQGTFTVKP